MRIPVSYLLTLGLLIAFSNSWAEGLQTKQTKLQDITFQTGCFDSDEHGPAILGPKAFRWLFYFSEQENLTVVYQAFNHANCLGEAIHETYQEYSLDSPKSRATKRGLFKDYGVNDLEAFYFWEKKTAAWSKRKKLLRKENCSILNLKEGEVFNLLEHCPEASIKAKQVLRPAGKFTVSVKGGNELLEIVAAKRKKQKRVAIFIAHSPRYVNTMNEDLSKELFNLNEELIHPSLQRKFLNQQWVGLCINSPFVKNNAIHSQQFIYLLSDVNILKERRLYFAKSNCHGKKYEQQRVFSLRPNFDDKNRFYHIERIKRVIYSTNFPEINDKFLKTLQNLKCSGELKGFYYDLAKRCPKKVMQQVNAKKQNISISLTPTTLLFYGRNGKDQDIIKAYSGVF